MYVRDRGFMLFAALFLSAACHPIYLHLSSVYTVLSLQRLTLHIQMQGCDTYVMLSVALYLQCN